MAKATLPGTKQSTQLYVPSTHINFGTALKHPSANKSQRYLIPINSLCWWNKSEGASYLNYVFPAVVFSQRDMPCLIPYNACINHLTHGTLTDVSVPYLYQRWHCICLNFKTKTAWVYLLALGVIETIPKIEWSNQAPKWLKNSTICNPDTKRIHSSRTVM